MSIEQSKLPIIVLAQNEVDSLESVISEWDSSLKNIPGLHHTFIICEDGSTDGTQELVTKLEHHYPIVDNSVSWRRGYAQAVRRRRMPHPHRACARQLHRAKAHRPDLIGKAAGTTASSQASSQHGFFTRVR
jgi:hypothetical protein